MRNTVYAKLFPALGRRRVDAPEKFAEENDTEEISPLAVPPQSGQLPNLSPSAFSAAQQMIDSGQSDLRPVSLGAFNPLAVAPETPVYNPDAPVQSEQQKQDFIASRTLPILETLKTMPVTRSDGQTVGGVQAVRENIARSPNMAGKWFGTSPVNRFTAPPIEPFSPPVPPRDEVGEIDRALANLNRTRDSQKIARLQNIETDLNRTSGENSSLAVRPPVSDTQDFRINPLANLEAQKADLMQRFKQSDSLKERREIKQAVVKLDATLNAMRSETPVSLGTGDAPQTVGQVNAPESIEAEPQTVASEIYGRPFEAMPELSRVVGDAFAQSGASDEQINAGQALVDDYLAQLPRSERAKLQQRYNEIVNKDYSLKKDADGNVISRGKDRDKDRDIWDMLRSIGLGALRGLQSGGLMGAIGGAVGGGIGGAFDRNFDDKLMDDLQLSRIRPQLAQAVEMETDNAKRLRTIIEAQGAVDDNEGRRLGNINKVIDNDTALVRNKHEILRFIRERNKPLYDAFLRDDVIDSAEAQKLKEMGYGEIPTGDYRTFKQDTFNGVPMATPTKGFPNYRPIPSAPIDPLKTVKTVTLPSGKTYPMTQEKAASIDFEITKGNFERAWQTTKENIQIENQNITTRNAFDEKRAKLQADAETASSLLETSIKPQKSALLSEMETAKNSLSVEALTVERTDKDGKKQAYSNPERTRLEKYIKDLEQQMRNVERAEREATRRKLEAENRLKTLPNPTNRAKLPNAPRLGGIQPMTRKEFIREAKKRGLTSKETAKAVQDAISQGIIQ